MNQHEKRAIPMVMAGTPRTVIAAMNKWLPFVLIVLGAALLISAAAFPIFFKPAPVFQTAPIPNQLAGFSISSQMSGSAAVQEFQQLHGKSFPILSGAKVVYGPENQVIVWTAGTASSTETRKLLIQMRDRIAQGQSPFQSLGMQTIANRPVYALDGMGQKHFYFQSGKYLVWLAANTEVADQAVQQVLDFYP